MSHDHGPRDPFPALAGPARPAGWWPPGNPPASPNPATIHDRIADLGSPVVVVDTPDGPAAAAGGATLLVGERPGPDWLPLLAHLPPLPPENVGDPVFRAAHGL